MFWGKKGATDKTGKPVSENSAYDDAAIDTVAALLRTLGRYAFDLDTLDARTINDRCEQWARHILIATPYPGGGQESTVKETSPQTQRNWEGVREFVNQLRRLEHSYVASNFREVRQVLGDFIQSLGKMFAEDQEDQTKITEVLNHLSTVIEETASAERIKREALQAIALIGRIAEERNNRQNNLLEEMGSKLKLMRDELSDARHEMELDPLTRLYNRGAFDEQLAHVFEFSKFSAQAACLLMVDADHFKKVNDNFGHPTGDLLLKQLADCCVHVFPRKTDYVARYGGEEFAVLLQDTSLETAKMLAERLLKAIRNLRINHAEGEVNVTASVGIAEIDPQRDSADWLRRADSALYRAKQKGRDRVEFSVHGNPP